jgi:ABC-2 type transport system permease protein
MTTSMSPAAPSVDPPSPAPLGAWRLEVLRLTRSPRGLALFGVYLAFGLLGPVAARYAQEILKHAQSGVTIIADDPRPSDGIANFVSQVNQTGLVVVVVVAAGALAFDARRGVATFLRSRISRMRQVVVPRVVVTAVAAIAAYVVGTMAAWYETALLIGPLSPSELAAGVLCQAVYLAFAVAVVALAASIARSMLGTVGIALAVLLLLPVAGAFSALHAWLPSSLASAPAALVETATLADYRGTLLLTAAATVGGVLVAIHRLQNREI